MWKKYATNAKLLIKLCRVDVVAGGWWIKFRQGERKKKVNKMR